MVSGPLPSLNVKIAIGWRPVRIEGDDNRELSCRRGAKSSSIKTGRQSRIPVARSVSPEAQGALNVEAVYHSVRNTHGIGSAGVADFKREVADTETWPGSAGQFVEIVVFARIPRDFPIDQEGIQIPSSEYIDATDPGDIPRIRSFLQVQECCKWCRREVVL